MIVKLVQILQQLHNAFQKIEQELIADEAKLNVWLNITKEVSDNTFVVKDTYGDDEDKGAEYESQDNEE